MQDQHYKGLIAEWYDDWLKAVTADRSYYLEFFRFIRLMRTLSRGAQGF